MKLISSAPGRVCLFGDHQDYLSLPVIAAAINRGIHIEATAIGGPHLLIDMPDIGQSRTINLNDDLNRFKPRDYFLSGIKVAKNNGCDFQAGLNIKITGDLPINAGASSSSALVVAWLQLLFEYYRNEPLKKNDLANFAYIAEIVEHHEPGGFMDHYTSAIGGLLYIENQQTVSYQKLDHPFENLMLANSRLSKQTIHVLNENKQKIFTAIDQLKSIDKDYKLEDRTIADIDSDIKNISSDLHDQYHAAVLNHEITLQAKKMFDSKQIDYLQLAELMNQHHEILKTKLKLTVPKIDKMIEIALANGADAAKINGSGLGGTIVIMARENKKNIIKLLKEIDADCYPVSVGRGAELRYE